MAGIVNDSLLLPNTSATDVEGQVKIGGNRFVSNYGTGNTFVGETAGNTTLTVVTAENNTGVGKNVLQNLTVGHSNTALGFDNLNDCTSGESNVAIGFSVLDHCTTGKQNVAVGSNVLDACIDGNYNTGLGWRALFQSVTDDFNTAVGIQSLHALNGGEYNTAIGASSGRALLTGVHNVLLGNASGVLYVGAESSNICVSAQGTAGDSNTIRLGTQGAGNGQQNRNFQAGIYGITPATVAATAIPLIDSTGQLGSLGLMTNGQLVIGSTTATPVVGSLASAGGTIAITVGAGTINLETGGAIATSFLTDDANSAVPALGVLTVAGGTNIGTTSAASTVTLNLDTALTAIDSLTNTNTPFALNTGTGTINISTDVAATTVNIANGAAVKTVTVGSNNATSQLILQSGTNGLNINSNDGGLIINSGIGALSISNDASATTVNVATGGAVKIVTIGSTNTTSSLDLQTGTGDFSLSSASGNLIDVTNLGVITLFNDLDVSEGGTGVSTLTSHGILMGNGAGDINATAEPSDGQILIGSTGNFPVLGTVTAGTNIQVTNAAGAITIDAIGTASFGWVEATVDATMVINTGYIANKAGLLTMTLPATAAQGSLLRITGINTAVGWRIAQNANQQIFFGTSNTTLGVGGYLEATAIRDSVELVCVVAGASTVWNVISSVGNITIV